MKTRIKILFVALVLITCGTWAYVSFTKPQAQSCTTFDCHEQHYTKLTQTAGAEKAFSDLKVRYAADPLVKSTCHQLVHAIGRGAFDRYGSVAAAYQHPDHFCWSGYFHGVMERALAKVPSNELTTTLNTLCADIPGKKRYSFDYYNCLHGLGHGVMFITNDDVPTSLVHCDNLVGNWEQQSCWSGVFMENVIIDEQNKDHQTKYLKPDDPLYPCNWVDAKYRQTCYLMQSSYMLKVARYNFATVFAQCATIEPIYQPTCFQSIGRDASGQSISDVVKTKATCLLGTTLDQQRNCIIGAVKDFISYHHGDAEAKQLCDAVPTQLQMPCRDTITSYATNL